MATIKLGPNGEIADETQIHFTLEERIYQMRAEIEYLRGALKKIAKLKISPDASVNGHILIMAKVMARVAVGEEE